jgi:hypothetical protein
MLSSNTTGDTGGYQISRSLRFNSADSAYLNRTFTTPTSSTVWTLSLWVKRGLLTGTYRLFGASTTTFLTFNSSDQLNLTINNVSAATSTAVFRDPSAWYHVVYQQNGSAQTLYVNNSSVATGTTAASVFNTAIAHQIGAANTANYFNGYLTEVNFIDGQALTPSSFGETNAQTGVWQPKRYTGTYGTNGFYLNFSDNSGTTATTLGKDWHSVNLLSYSQNFENAAWSKENGASISATDSKVAPDGTTTADTYLQAASPGGAAIFQFNSLTAGQTYTASIYVSKITGRYHFLMLVIGGGSQYSRVIFDIDTLTVGTPATAGSGWSYVSSSITAESNGFYRLSITATVGFTGSIAPYYFISDGINSGTRLANGSSYIWGAQLELGSALTTYTQANNWTPNNFSVTPGAGNDSMVDTPTPYGTDTGVGGQVRGNYCTMNPLQNPSGVTVSNGNLDMVTPNNSITGLYGTFGVSSGKWYWEFTQTAYTIDGAPRVGIANGIGGTFWTYNWNATKQTGGTSVSYGATFTNNDVIGVALDIDSGTLTFYKNGTSQGTAYTGLAAGTYFPLFWEVGTVDTYTANVNFGQRPFAFSAPAGYKCLTTTNLP